MAARGNTKTITVSFPVELAEQAERLAKTESRTMSELIREALRQYERRSWWDEVNAYGRAQADRQGIREQDVDRLIHEVRASTRANTSANKRAAKK